MILRPRGYDADGCMAGRLAIPNVHTAEIAAGGGVDKGAWAETKITVKASEVSA